MNALMRLNQIRPGLQYRLLSQSGPVHAPVFTMSVDLDGTIYEASGSSKKTAKLHVAVKVRRPKKFFKNEAVKGGRFISFFFFLATWNNFQPNLCVYKYTFICVELNVSVCVFV